MMQNYCSLILIICCIRSVEIIYLKTFGKTKKDLTYMNSDYIMVKLLQNNWKFEGGTKGKLILSLCL